MPAYINIYINNHFSTWEGHYCVWVLRFMFGAAQKKQHVHTDICVIVLRCEQTQIHAAEAAQHDQQFSFSSVWQWLCQFSHQSFQLVQPIQMFLHTKPLIFHRKEEGLPPLIQLLSHTGLSLPHCRSRSLSLSLSHPVFLQHMPVVMLMSVAASAPQSGCSSHPLPSRRWCVITEQCWVRWSDWWGDCGLLTQVFV